MGWDARNERAAAAESLLFVGCVLQSEREDSKLRTWKASNCLFWTPPGPFRGPPSPNQFPGHPSSESQTPNLSVTRNRARVAQPGSWDCGLRPRRKHAEPTAPAHTQCSPTRDALGLINDGIAAANNGSPWCCFGTGRDDDDAGDA